jgi:hypothetical protein
MAKQTEIPGTERPSNPEVEEAAEEYRALRDERMHLQEKEGQAKAALLDRLKAHNLTSYRYADSDGVERKIMIQEKENVKIAKIKASDSGGESAEDVAVS